MSEHGIGAAAQEQINRIISRLSPEDQAHLRERLRRVIIHRRAVAQFATPGHLGQFARPGFLQTPMLDKIDQALMEAERGEHRQWLINTPPQEGKTTRLQDGALWFLLRRPWLRIAFASYEQGIAARSGLEIRQIIETHGSGYRGQGRELDRVDTLGLMLDPDRSLQTNWSLADVPGMKNKRPGGVLSVGIGSSFTGRPADMLIVDDPLKDAKQADSAVYRKAVQDWFQAVASTRLSPGATIIVIQTRWHDEDLTGWLLAEDSYKPHPEWRHLNIPAQAESPDDPLGRAPGEFLVSARGRSVEEWEKKKRDLGSRWWNALYQGNPSPPDGGTFQRDWFEKGRVERAPELLRTVVFVDPADNDGTGDEAGIVTGGLGVDGDVYLLEDNSGHYTVAQWVRVALFALLRNGASRLMYERSLSGLQRSIRAQWKVIRRQARELATAQEQWSRFGQDDWPAEPHALAVQDAMLALGDADDSPDDIAQLRAELVELWPYVPQVLRLPMTGPPTKAVTPRGSKQLRAELVSPLYETGRAHHVGLLGKLEHQMATWQPTQDSPDRMDAAVHLLDQLSQHDATGGLRRPQGSSVPTRQQSSRQAMPSIRRSTRYGP